ncbi:cathepsin B-like CP3 [Bemisia tabaci]
MEVALRRGPLPVGYPQSPSILMYYVRGIFAPPYWVHDTTTGHAVVIVGHYDTAPYDCWILRNSWGPDWGMEGHFLVQKRTMGIGWNVNKIVRPLIQQFWSEPGSEDPSTPSDDGAGPSYHNYQLPDMSQLNIHDDNSGGYNYDPNYYYPQDYNNYYRNY